jgi:hypothetical protein
MSPPQYAGENRGNADCVEGNGEGKDESWPRCSGVATAVELTSHDGRRDLAWPGRSFFFMILIQPTGETFRARLEAPDRQPRVVSTDGGALAQFHPGEAPPARGAQACWPLEARGNSSHSYTSLLSQVKIRNIKNCFENSNR